jgi:hypothetical protein
LRGGPQQAPEFPGARQVGPVPGPEQKILAFGRRIVAQRPRLIAVPGIRKPVIGIGPRGGLLGVAARRVRPGGEPRQPEPAALADPRERLTIAPKLQRDLIWLPGPVTAGDGKHGENRAIDAA